MRDPQIMQISVQCLDIDLLDSINEDTILARADEIRERRAKEAADDNRAIRAETERITQPAEVVLTQGRNGPDFTAQ